MHADGFDEDRAAILVVAGMLDELAVEGVEEAAPGVHGVVALEDIFACIVQMAVTEEKAKAAELEVVLVVALDGIGDECEAELVLRSAGDAGQAEEAI